MLQLKIVMMKTLKNFMNRSSYLLVTPNHLNIICIMGDLNAKVGNVTDFNIIGNYGLGNKMKEVKDL